MTSDVLFVYRGDRAALLADSARGDAPNEFLYGLPYVRDPRLRVGYVEDAPASGRWPELALRAAQSWFGRRYGIGFSAHAYWRERARLEMADVIVSTLDSYGLPILVAKAAGRVRARVVYISQGLFHIAERARHSAFDERVRRVLGTLLERADLIVALGEGDAAAIENAFGDVARLRIRTILFGIDAAFWRPDGQHCDGPILSVGSDALRDYPTLLRAIGERPLRVVTRLEVPGARGRNVVVSGEVGWGGLRELYQRAPFVVSPIRDVRRNSGHSATLQAMACGKAVILSDTRGLWDRARMRHGETCWLVPPEDPEALARAIEHLATDPDEAARIGRNARALVESEYSAERFGRRLETAILELVAQP